MAVPRTSMQSGTKLQGGRTQKISYQSHSSLCFNYLRFNLVHWFNTNVRVITRKPETKNVRVGRIQVNQIP